MEGELVQVQEDCLGLALCLLQFPADQTQVDTAKVQQAAQAEGEVPEVAQLEAAQAEASQVEGEVPAA